MIRRIWAACVVEWTKYSRMPLPYAGLVVVVLIAAGTLWVHPISHDGVSDFGFIAQAVPASLNLAGVLMVLVYSSTLVAGDVDSGVLRTLLVRPIRRSELLLAKLFNGIAYATLATSLAVFVSWVCGMVFGELSGIVFGDELMFATNEMYAAMFIATVFNLPPYFAAVGYAFMVSTISRKPAAAIGMTVGGWLIVDFIKYPLGIADFVFTSYLDRTWIVFQDRCDALDTGFFPAVLQSAGVSFAWFGLCVGLSLFLFRRRSFGP